MDEKKVMNSEAMLSSALWRLRFLCFNTKNAATAKYMYTRAQKKNNNIWNNNNNLDILFELKIIAVCDRSFSRAELIPRQVWQIGDSSSCVETGKMNGNKQSIDETIRFLNASTLDENTGKVKFTI